MTLSDTAVDRTIGVVVSVLAKSKYDTLAVRWLAGTVRLIIGIAEMIVVCSGDGEFIVGQVTSPP